MTLNDADKLFDRIVGLAAAYEYCVEQVQLHGPKASPDLLDARDAAGAELRKCRMQFRATVATGGA